MFTCPKKPNFLPVVKIFLQILKFLGWSFVDSCFFHPLYMYLLFCFYDGSMTLEVTVVLSCSYSVLEIIFHLSLSTMLPLWSGSCPELKLCLLSLPVPFLLAIVSVSTAYWYITIVGGLYRNVGVVAIDFSIRSGYWEASDIQSV